MRSGRAMSNDTMALVSLTVISIMTGVILCLTVTTPHVTRWPAILMVAAVVFQFLGALARMRR